MRVFLFFIITLTSCASLSTWPTPSSQLIQHYDQNLKTKRLLDEGREVLTVKAIRVTPQLVMLQKQRAPGFEVKLSEGEDVWILAATVRGREATDVSDLKVVKNGHTASGDLATLIEIGNQDVLETLYPFAWPYHRVFVARFSSATRAESLRVMAPTGAVVFESERTQ
jgi:hypothetical protein